LFNKGAKSTVLGWFEPNE